MSHLIINNKNNIANIDKIFNKMYIFFRLPYFILFSSYRLIVDLFLRLIEIVHVYVVSPNLSHCSQVNMYCVISNVRSGNSKRCIRIWTRFVTVSLGILEKKNNREETACSSWHNVLFFLFFSLLKNTNVDISDLFF